MSSINLGNGGTYCNGYTWYTFKPYGRSLPQLDGYKKIDIGNLRNVWAKVEDRGEYKHYYQCSSCSRSGESKQIGCEEHPTEGSVLIHVQPRYSINILGWGSNTVGSHLCIFENEIDKEEFWRLYCFLTE